MKCIAYPITADTKFPIQTKIWVRSSFGHQWLIFWSNGLHENAHPAINISNNVYNWVSGYDFWHPLYGGDFTVYDQPEIPVAPPPPICEQKLQQQATKHSLEINRMSIELNAAINAERERANERDGARTACDLHYQKAKNVQKTLDEVIVERNRLKKENEELRQPKYVLNVGGRSTGKTAATFAKFQLEIDLLHLERDDLKKRIDKIKAAMTSDLDEEPLIVDKTSYKERTLTKADWEKLFEAECKREASNH